MKNWFCFITGLLMCGTVQARSLDVVGVEPTWVPGNPWALRKSKPKEPTKSAAEVSIVKETVPVAEAESTAEKNDAENLATENNSSAEQNADVETKSEAETENVIQEGEISTGDIEQPSGAEDIKAGDISDDVKSVKEKAKASGEAVSTDSEQPVSVEEIIVEPETRKEIRKLKKMEAIEKERSNVDSPIKRKAIERAEEREKRKEEILREKAESASRFQKVAKERQLEREEKKIEVQRERDNKDSRFAEKARQRAAERDRKKQERIDRKNRGRK